VNTSAWIKCERDVERDYLDNEGVDGMEYLKETGTNIKKLVKTRSH
jgi:hypothetical protein